VNEMGGTSQPGDRVATNPARWVSDPFGRHELRYWNGERWTEHVADQGVQATDPPVERPAPQQAVPPMAIEGRVISSPETISSAAGAGQWGPGEDHDGHTISAAELARLTSGAPALRVAELWVTFDDGSQHNLGSRALLGRNPSRRDDEPHAKVVVLDDPTRSVSKTHLALGADGQGLWVEDRHSVNGTTIDKPDGSVVSVEPGSVARMPSGSVVRFGDRTMLVELTS
jgi:hypothetical protein